MSAWASGGGRVAGPRAGAHAAVGTLKGRVCFHATDDNGHLEYEAQVSMSQSRVFFHKAN